MICFYKVGHQWRPGGTSPVMSWRTSSICSGLWKKVHFWNLIDDSTAAFHSICTCIGHLQKPFEFCHLSCLCFALSPCSRHCPRCWWEAMDVTGMEFSLPRAQSGKGGDVRQTPYKLVLIVNSLGEHCEERYRSWECHRGCDRGLEGSLELAGLQGWTLTLSYIIMCSEVCNRVIDFFVGVGICSHSSRE